jgi:DNA-binding transcriptional MocR family regulator
MPDDNAEDRVIQELRAAAAALAPGARLPSVRDLTARHRASPLTVQRAVARLAAEGLVEPRPGRGTFVAARAKLAAGGPAPATDLGWQAVALGAAPAGGQELQALLAVPRPGAIPLSGGYLEPALQPLGALGAALARAARRPGAWERGPAEGRAELRAWFARTTGAGHAPEDVLICPGGQPALATAFRALADPGDPVLVEAPTYLGAVAAARAAGLRVVPVPADAGGIRPELLAAALERSAARLVYLQPLHANPHGATLAADRRAAVLDAVRQAGAFLVEDDWARDLAIDGEPPAPLAAEDPGGHVVHVRSLTKAAAPGLRVGAIAARGPAAERLRVARLIDDFYVSGPLQEAAVELLASPAWTRHARLLRAGLRARRDALLAALAEHLPGLRAPAIPRGGLHVWLALPAPCDDVALARAAAEAGVVVFPGRPFFAAEPPGAFLRLTFGAAPPADLAEGVRRLAQTMMATVPPSADHAAPVT